MTDPVHSRADAAWHQPPGSPRRFLLAPLTRRERNLFRRDLVAAGAVYPGDAQLLAVLRKVLTEMEPTNLADLLATIEQAEAEAEEADAGAPAGPARQALAPIEAAARAAPAYAALLADREFYLATYPTLLARHALRGWEGEGLPPFARRGGLVPEDLLEAVGDAELSDVGYRAHALSFVTRSAEKNSEPPSPSPESPTDGTAS